MRTRTPERGRQGLCAASSAFRLDFATAYILEPNSGKKDLIFRAFWILGLQIRDYGSVFVNKFIIFLKETLIKLIMWKTN